MNNMLCIYSHNPIISVMKDITLTVRTSSYLAVLSNGWDDPTNFLIWTAILDISSERSDRRVRYDVG